MRVIMELLRIICIFLLLGSLGSILLVQLYSLQTTTIEFQWLGIIAIFLLLFVFYRNKLQFSGWFTGKKQNKLPKRTANIMVICAILMMISPFFLGFLYN